MKPSSWSFTTTKEDLNMSKLSCSSSVFFLPGLDMCPCTDRTRPALQQDPETRNTVGSTSLCQWLETKRKVHRPNETARTKWLTQKGFRNLLPFERNKSLKEKYSASPQEVQTCRVTSQSAETSVDSWRGVSAPWATDWGRFNFIELLHPQKTCITHGRKETLIKQDLL